MPRDPETIRAEYIGSHRLRIGDRVFDKTQRIISGGRRINKDGVVLAVCRDLIAELAFTYRTIPRRLN